tara:strand:- start:30733 stop:31779 length:1047 start_codon:yes stop_codon:yes gene_type:complete
MTRILVTGFEPFGGHSRNISQDVTHSLPVTFRLDDPWEELRESPHDSLNVEIEKRILSVDGEGSLEVSTAIRDGEQWDAILHLGLCESCEIPRLEILAQDCINMKIPDNSGRQLSQQSITGQGNISVEVPVESWMSRAWPMSCELSQDAGTFLCNETLYRTLAALEAVSKGKKSITPCLFVHLPPSEKCTIDSAREFVQEVLRRMMFKPVLSVVAALISRDDKYLAARRSASEKHSGMWEFPGGKVEPNESKKRALERELLEEFGWSMKCENSVGTWFHSLTNVDIALHVLPAYFNGELPNLNDKNLWTAHDEITWRTLDDDSHLDWLGNDASVVEWMKETNYLVKSR